MYIAPPASSAEHARSACWSQELRGKKGEARAGKTVETSLILLEGRVVASEKQLDLLLAQLHEVFRGYPHSNGCARVASGLEVVKCCQVCKCCFGDFFACPTYPLGDRRSLCSRGLNEYAPRKT